MFFGLEVRIFSKIVMIGVGILRFSSKIVMFVSPPSVAFGFLPQSQVARQSVGAGNVLGLFGREDTKETKTRRGGGWHWIFPFSPMVF
jgi:hypothetical protein